MRFQAKQFYIFLKLFFVLLLLMSAIALLSFRVATFREKEDVGSDVRNFRLQNVVLNYAPAFCECSSIV